MNLSKFEPHLAGGYKYIYRNILANKTAKIYRSREKKKLQKLMSYTSNTKFAKTNQNFKKVRHLLNTPYLFVRLVVLCPVKKPAT